MADFLCGDGAPPWSRAARQAWFDTWCCVCLAVSFLVHSGSSSEKGGSPPSPPPPPALGSHTRVATKRRVGSRSPVSHTRVATGRAERDVPTPIFCFNYIYIFCLFLFVCLIFFFFFWGGGGGGARIGGVFGGRGVWAGVLGGMGGAGRLEWYGGRG